MILQNLQFQLLQQSLLLSKLHRPGCHQHRRLTMSKKTVIKADLIGEACKRDILSAVAKLRGIKSMEIDADKCTLTVVGDVDPVRVAQKLKKACFAATIVSVEDDKPKEKEKEKEKCDKASCCKEKCERECKGKCEKSCKAEWLEEGRCSCGGGGGGCISYTPCAVPSYPAYYYGYGSSGWPYGGGCISYTPSALPSYPAYYYAGYGSSGWPYGGVYCYEETSPAGQCVIQ